MAVEPTTKYQKRNKKADFWCWLVNQSNTPPQKAVGQTYFWLKEKHLFRITWAHNLLELWG